MINLTTNSSNNNSSNSRTSRQPVRQRVNNTPPLAVGVPPEQLRALSPALNSGKNVNSNAGSVASGLGSAHDSDVMSGEDSNQDLELEDAVFEAFEKVSLPPGLDEAEQQLAWQMADRLRTQGFWTLRRLAREVAADLEYSARGTALLQRPDAEAALRAFVKYVYDMIRSVTDTRAGIRHMVTTADFGASGAESDALQRAFREAEAKQQARRSAQLDDFSAAFKAATDNASRGRLYETARLPQGMLDGFLNTYYRLNPLTANVRERTAEPGKRSRKS